MKYAKQKVEIKVVSITMDHGNTPDLIHATLPSEIGGDAVVWTPGMGAPELVSRDERAERVEGLIEDAAERGKI